MICRTCVGGYVQQQVEVLEGGSVDKFRELTKNGGRLSCADRSCKGILHTDAMYNLIDWKLLGVLAEWASRANRARCAEEGENLGADGAGALLALSLMRFCVQSAPADWSNPHTAMTWKRIMDSCLQVAQYL